MDYARLGERVRRQRILLGMTQEQLAEKAGISCSFVGHIERGEKKASIETVVALCNAMVISPSVLLQDSLSSEVLVSQMEMDAADQRMYSGIMRVLRERGVRDGYGE